jgi:hypothetical protein
MNKTSFSPSKYAIVLFFCMTSLFAAPQAKQLLSPEGTMKLIETIKSDAIVLGNGEKEVHVFIDPLCKMSQRYLKLLYKRHKQIFPDYTIHLYLNELKAKKSKKHILNIIHSQSKEKMLCDIMLGNKSPILQRIKNGDTKDIFQKISQVAKEIGVYKRPYILINGKAK